jgi:predicted enzyme related to lactoylglutathione lyase
MGMMEKHAAGTVCWAELASGDAEGSKRFYRSLFDWELEDKDIGGAVYTIARLHERDAAALYQTQGPEARLPARWRIHLSVPDADAAARKARERGARLSLAPTDVPGAGRFALLQDASGAPIGIWEAKGHIGAGVLGMPGALAWAELVTRETETAKRFYADWLGWESRVLEPGAYALFLKGGHPVAGMIRMAEESAGGVPHWRAYFQTADCGATVARARGLGAQCQLPATPIPGVGTVALLTDPQGGLFALMESSSGRG